jgi:hypothetical protein
MSDDPTIPNLLAGIRDAITSLNKGEVPPQAKADPREEVLIRYTIGTGQFSNDHQYNVLIMKMFKLNGEPDGHHEGIWHPLITPDQMKAFPLPPQGPFDKPQGPVDPIEISTFTKAIWTFGDGSSVTARGPANLRLVDFKDGSAIFLVSVAAIITNGTGRFEGCRGVKTALGSTFVPKGVDLFNFPPDQQFGAYTVETFRIIKKEYL